MRELKTEELELVAGGNDPQEGNGGNPLAIAINLTNAPDLCPQEGNEGNP